MRERLSSLARQPGGIGGGGLWQHGEGNGSTHLCLHGSGAAVVGNGARIDAARTAGPTGVGTIDAELSRIASWSLVAEMSRDEATSRIHETHIAQPSIFALQVALTELWKSWGIVPDQVIGHSVGEVAAAYAAGIYSLSDATRLVFPSQPPAGLDARHRPHACGRHPGQRRAATDWRSARSSDYLRTEQPESDYLCRRHGRSAGNCRAARGNKRSSSSGSASIMPSIRITWIRSATNCWNR